MRHSRWWTLLIAGALVLSVAVAWSGGLALSRAVGQSLTRVVTTKLKQLLPGGTTVGPITASPWSIALQSLQWRAAALAHQPLLQVRQIMLQPSLSAFLTGRLNFSRVTVGELMLTNAVTSEPVVHAHRIIVQPTITSARLLGRLVFSRVTIDQLSLSIVRMSDGQWNFSAMAPQDAAGSAQTEQILQRFFGHGKLLVQRFEVLDGTVLFADEAAKWPVKLRAHHVRLVIEATPLPGHLAATRVLIEGKIQAQPDGYDSPFRVSGWVDPVTKDMEMKFHIAEVELGPLEPYYQGRITKVNMGSGRVTLQGTAEALANNVTITSRVTLSNLREAGISILGRTLVDVSGSLDAVQGSMSGELIARGQLDKPAEWRYELGQHQAPLLLLFVPFMKRSGERTVIKIGRTELDVGSAAQQWLGPIAPGAPPAPTPAIERPKLSSEEVLPESIDALTTTPAPEDVPAADNLAPAPAAAPSSPPPSEEEPVPALP